MMLKIRSRGMKKHVCKVRKVRRAIRKTEAEKILITYRDLCLEKREEREGYRISLKEAHKRVGKIHTISVAVKFLAEVDRVIIAQRLQECFPYGQAFFHLKEMVVDKIEEMQKIKNHDEEVENNS